ncbi:HTH domain-containing protein [Chitinophaga sp. XS-30]|uniref:HTH domain-containing protein n=1 Tax=Chitinophaga sp. XS-30 TaxID=2604421 RepID=UPI0011DDCF70|nr:HTH domain-containing protein [Chitinophaga sp. XS-30]QEH42200.1 HTH domain-containing protein [Chitinophaga sp. XS-30]
MTTDTLQRLQRIDHLIQTKATGTPSNLADKIGISERCVYKYLNLMKDFGAPIKFSNARQSYYYDEEGYFKISFRFKRRIMEMMIAGMGYFLGV